MLKKVFGIPSWLPDEDKARELRIARINRLFKQLNDLWPNIDIMVIAQNWKGFRPIKTTNNQIIIEYPQLGILGARKALRTEFLARNYDYIIMFDDDAIIECTTPNAHFQYMEELDKHENGFCFIHGHNSKYHPYVAAQLNLCAISRFIYEQEPMVDVDPQKDEGFEDSIFACLLHHKWGQYEFDPPTTIKTIQFRNKQENAPSTWANEHREKMRIIIKNTDIIQEYIMTNKVFPPNYKQLLYIEPPIVNPIYGRPGTYLYF